MFELDSEESTTPLELRLRQELRAKAELKLRQQEHVPTIRTFPLYARSDESLTRKVEPIRDSFASLTSIAMRQQPPHV